MAPQSGELLVLDEVQWADDEERGSAWTRLLLAGEYREILLLGALDALPLVERAFPEAEPKVFERKLPLDFVGERTLASLTPGTVVVAFSRRAVIALAGEVNRRHPGRVAVLYGAMPLASRREEIDRFLSRSADVCVATDVLGHGVNLPCETLLFAETTKFDGQDRRPLLAWELAQIAGRAGRFGLVERGHVGVLAGLGWGEADGELVESALEPHVPLPGGHRGYRVVDEARIRPRLSDLGVRDPIHLDAALVAWHRVAIREWAFESWLAVESLQPLRMRLDAVQKRLGERGRRLALEETWTLVNAPVDEDGLELLATLALALAGDRVARPHLNFLLDTARLRGAALEDAEQAGREASILRWFALQFPGVGGVTIERAAALEEAAAERVVARLRLEVESPTIGRCRSCGRSCPPWFPLCDRCAGVTARS
jgi:ATP-dependent RNA helicase SUPV3L1/SUV3